MLYLEDGISPQDLSSYLRDMYSDQGGGGGQLCPQPTRMCEYEKVMDMGLFWAPSEWSEWTCFHSKLVSNVSLHSIWGISLDNVHWISVFSNPFLRCMYSMSH